MNRFQQRIPFNLPRTIVALVVVIIIGWFLVEIYSARIPERWQYIGRGYTPEEIRDRLEHAPESYTDVIIMHNEEIYELRRLLGRWKLFVYYRDDGAKKISTGSHFRYDSNLLGVFTRMRNFSNPKGIEDRNW